RKLIKFICTAAVAGVGLIVNVIGNLSVWKHVLIAVILSLALCFLRLRKILQFFIVICHLLCHAMCHAIRKYSNQTWYYFRGSCTLVEQNEP
ncbi:unnamed protein product, partial [Rotaria socialis]